MIYIAAILTGLLVLATVLPHIPIAHGVVRVADFPRQQIVFITLVLLAATLLLEPGWQRYLLQAVLALIVAVQTALILPFTPLWRKQTATYDARRDRDGRPLRLITCNVKQSNRDYGALIGLLRDRDPDIFVLMEVDHDWRDALAETLGRYETTVEQPQDNTYGMILASRFPLDDVEVTDLLTKGVPSIRATVSLSDDLCFRLYAIHPEPPVPNHGTEGRDGETGIVALMVRDEKLPVLVTGDLNDVAWSRTTHRFRRVSRLLDPRLGRAIFSTFDARYPVIRWPLDHLFVAPQFRLNRMERLRAVGSDHFPVQFDLVLCPDAKAHDRPGEANGDEKSRARELAGQAKQRKEEPIGTDWEN